MRFPINYDGMPIGLVEDSPKYLVMPLDAKTYISDDETLMTPMNRLPSV